MNAKSADCARTCYLNQLAPNSNHRVETHNANSYRRNNLLKIGFNFKKDLGLYKQDRHRNSMISTDFEMFFWYPYPRYAIFSVDIRKTEIGI